MQFVDHRPSFDCESRGHRTRRETLIFSLSPLSLDPMSNAIRVSVGLIFVFLIAAVNSANRGEASVTVPRTIADFKGGVHSLAQDGSRVGWLFDSPGLNCARVRIVNLMSGGRATLTQSNKEAQPNAFCATENALGKLVLSRTRALWSVTAAGNSEYTSIWFATLQKPAGRAIYYSEYDESRGGGRYGGIVGSGPTLAYGIQQLPLQLVDGQGEASGVKSIMSEAG